MSSDETTEALHAALMVLTEDPRHVEWLKATDPNGLKQALTARKLYLDAKLQAMVRPMSGGGLLMGKSRVRMGIGEEISALDDRLAEVERILAAES